MNPGKKQIIVINSQNSLVTDGDVRLMVSACNTLMSHVMEHWRPGSSADVLFRTDMLAGGISSSGDACRFFIVDEHLGIPGALAMYNETGFRSNENPSGWTPTGFVFTRSILSNNGVVLCDSANPGRPTVAAALFKAIAESIVNPSRNLWWNDPVSGEFIAAKICDPVEATPVIITLEVARLPDTTSDEQKCHDEDIKDHDDIPPLVDIVPGVPESIKLDVALCNFILPAWSDPNARDGTRFDFGNVLKHAFEIGVGGYCSKYDSQIGITPRIVFNRHVPGWRRELAKTSYISFNAVR